ncbi:MAG: hypothetical protein ACLR06_14315 [Christensenellaceae bacterium]
MKYGVQLYSLRETAEREGAEKILQMVSEAGYDGVEFAGFYGRTPEEMKELLKNTSLSGFRRISVPRRWKKIFPISTLWGSNTYLFPGRERRNSSRRKSTQSFCPKRKSKGASRRARRGVRLS